MTNSVMQSAQPHVRGLWKFLYVMSFIIACVAIAFVAFTFVQTRRLVASNTQTQKNIATLQADIELAQQDPMYKRYAAAKQLSTSITTVGRGDRLSRIMGVFTTLQQLGGGGTRFSDFNVGFSTLTMKGVVRDLTLVYGKG